MLVDPLAREELEQLDPVRRDQERDVREQEVDEREVFERVAPLRLGPPAEREQRLVREAEAMVLAVLAVAVVAGAVREGEARDRLRVERTEVVALAEGVEGELPVGAQPPLVAVDERGATELPAAELGRQISEVLVDREGRVRRGCGVDEAVLLLARELDEAMAAGVDRPERLRLVHPA